jgi:hypothetical protein
MLEGKGGENVRTAALAWCGWRRALCASRRALPPLCHPYAIPMPPLCHPYATLRSIAVGALRVAPCVATPCHPYAIPMPPLCHPAVYSGGGERTVSVRWSSPGPTARRASRAGGGGGRAAGCVTGRWAGGTITMRSHSTSAAPLGSALGLGLGLGLVCSPTRAAAAAAAAAAARRGEGTAGAAAAGAAAAAAAAAVQSAQYHSPSGTAARGGTRQ